MSLSHQKGRGRTGRRNKAPVPTRSGVRESAHYKTKSKDWLEEDKPLRVVASLAHLESLMEKHRQAEADF